MSRSYLVDPKKYHQLALRKTIKRTLLFILIFALLYMLMIILKGGYIDKPILQSWWPLIILPLYIGMTYFRQKKLSAVLEFKIDDEKLEKIIHLKKLDLPEQIKHQKRAIKHNISFETSIFFKDIKNLVITKNTLKVKGKHYNMFTRAGLISIPKEVEHYEEIVTFFRKFIER